MSEQERSNFGSKLRQLREAVGLTQEALAQAAGMHKFGIAKLERGEREPSWATVKTLAKVLGVNCLAFESEGKETGEETPRPRGRPRKTDTSTEVPSTAPDELPAPQRKPRERKTRKPRGG
jgi:transcriptional regulator with XRE-family HTH domain